MKWETFKIRDFVWLKLEVWRYVLIYISKCHWDQEPIVELVLYYLILQYYYIFSHSEVIYL